MVIHTKHTTIIDMHCHTERGNEKGFKARKINQELTIKQSLKSSLSTRIPLFRLVCAIAVIGLTSCMQQAKELKDASPEVAQETPSSGRLCDVGRVYDGDTLWVKCEGQWEKLRLYCIDAPEMQQRPWGKQSRDYLRSIVGDVVSVERFDKDRYGRTVARIWSAGVDLNGQMIRDGWAVIYPRYCPDEENQYRSDESEAVRLRTSLWRREGLHTSPWKWRAK